MKFVENWNHDFLTSTGFGILTLVSVSWRLCESFTEALLIVGVFVECWFRVERAGGRGEERRGKKSERVFFSVILCWRGVKSRWTVVLGEGEGIEVRLLCRWLGGEGGVES